MKLKTAYLGLLLAFALILSYVEVLIPFSFGIPGVKLGLANMAVLLTLYLFGYRDAFLLTVVKALLCGILFGNMTMILYSLSGAMLSFLAMAVMIKIDRFHLFTVSAMGGVMHNVGQLLVAYFTVKTYSIFYYVPILILSGLIAGILIGIIVVLVMPYIRKAIRQENYL